jgi:hypothetical protein
MLGRTLRLDDRPHTIIGVMPPRFGWWTDDGVWLPLGTETRDSTRAFPIARLKSGTPPTAGEQQLNVYLQERAKAAPADYPREEFTAMLTNYLDMTVASGEMQPLALVLCSVRGVPVADCLRTSPTSSSRRRCVARDGIRLSVGAGARDRAAIAHRESVVVEPGRWIRF